jgi:sugar (pentulose or hexulose) kinase
VELGLSTDAWVMNGAHDQYAAALGAGVIHPGQVLLSCGTAWVVLLVTSRPHFGQGTSAMAVSRHPVDGLWGALRSMAGVGTTVEWYVDTILAPLGGFAGADRSLAFKFMDEHLSTVPVGSNGLFCLPLEGGHASGRRPAGGTLWGLKAQHLKADIGRAVLEGIAYELRWLVETVETDQTPISSFVMVGGASQSACWPRIVAEVVGRPVTVPAHQEAGARGAALLAGIGLGCFTAEHGFTPSLGDHATYEPNPEIHDLYGALFGEYQARLEVLTAADREIVARSERRNASGDEARKEGGS